MFDREGGPKRKQKAKSPARRRSPLRLGVESLETRELLSGLVITTPSLTNWTVNQPGYNQTINAAGATGAVTFGKTGSVPPGLTLVGPSYTALDDPSAIGGGHTGARGVSGGTVVGFYVDASLQTHGFSYNGTNYTTLDDPSASGGTFAEGISGSTIVGYYDDGTGSHGFSVSGTNYTTLDDPSASGGTFAEGISDSTIVGYYVDGTGSHGFSVSGTHYTTLDDPSATGGTYAEGISGSTIVGYYVNGTGSHGFSVSGTHYTTLDDPSAAPGQTYAEGVAGSNVVGFYYDAGNNAHGFVFDDSTSTWTTLVDPAATTGQTAAYGISGSTIVGQYQDATGYHGFLYNLVLPTLSGSPTAVGTYNFTVTETDTTGSTASQAYAVTINPAVTITTSSLTGWTAGLSGYNQIINATGGTGSLTFSSMGTLPTGLTLSGSGVLSGTPTAGGNYTFTVTATDTVGAADAMTYTISIASSGPTLVVSTQATATAGTSFNLTVTAEDGGGHTSGGFSGTVTLSSSAGSDLSPTTVLLTGGTATIPVTLTAAGSQILTAAFTGLTSGTASVTVSAGPLGQYQVAVPASSTVQAGTGFLVTVQAADAFGNPITSYSGPPTVTARISPTSAASNFPTTVSIGTNGLGLFLADLQTVRTYTIKAASGSFSGSAAPVNVTPAPPATLAFAVQPVATPTGVTLPTVTVDVQDQYGNLVATDNTDTVTLGVASGPGSFMAGSTTSAPVHNGVATFSNLMLVAPGSYTLSANVPFLYTGPNSTSFAVAPLQVLPGSFAATPSGFSLQFNAPFLVNSVTPVLYGQGFGAAAPVPSVTLTQTKDSSGRPVDNPVEGSVILNTATNSITFLATNTSYQVHDGSPLLPDGTYTVDLTDSAAHDGFRALTSGGGFLDGLGTGKPGSGDYKATFTVTAGAANEDVLWLPATADGPGQALSAPGNNQIGGGYPVYLNDNTGAVTNVLLTVNYDPTLLTVTGVSGAGFSLLATSTAGHAVLQYSGPDLPTGDQTPIGFITATVPAGTTADPTAYKAKDLLDLSGVSLNNGAISVATSDGLHLVAFVADADGNGSYSSNDSVLITRVALLTDTGFAAYPLVDPVIVADTDGAGSIPADAALQANEAGVGFPTANLTLPPIPGGIQFRTVANGVDPSVSLPSNLQVAADGMVTVPVNINDAHPEGSTGLIEAHLALTYDPRQFSVSAADVHLGSVLAAGTGWSVVPTIDPTTGQIAIALSSATPISSTIGGSLVTIDFHSTGEPGGGSPRIPTAIALVASITPNGQYFATELEDAQGSFTLTPAPTNGFDPRIDSVVMLTATPGPAVVSAPAVSEVALSAATAVGTPIFESSMVEIATAEPANPSLSAEVSASDEQRLAAAPIAIEDTAPLHVSGTIAHAAALVAASSAVAFTNASMLGAAPLAGLVFQVAGTAVPSVQGATGQQLADPLFIHGSANPSDPILVSPVRDAFKLAGQWLRSLSVSDSLDSLNWDEMGSALDWQGADAGAPVSHRGRRALPPSQCNPRPTLQEVTPDRAALDEYFARTADNTEDE